MPSARVAHVPYISGAMMTGALPPAIGTELIRTAYQTLYDRTHPPEKYCDGERPRLLWMPYQHAERGHRFEKHLVIDPDRRPGVWGYAVLSEMASPLPLAIFDATVLTGIRTAAKSALFAMECFAHWQQVPENIVIYGASTQAVHHAIQFRAAYPQAQVYLMTRSAQSCRTMATILSHYGDGYQYVVDEERVDFPPDIIITTTSSTTPVITETNVRSAQLLIAVGSSSGDVSEIAPAIVPRYRCVVDAQISIAGKGELAIPLRLRLMEAAAITELRDFLNDADKTTITTQPHLFVSKGLVIEDYVVALWFLQHINF